MKCVSNIISYMREIQQIGKYSGVTVEDELKLIDSKLWQACKDESVIVEAWQDEQMDDKLHHMTHIECSW